jgi:hypothetical protein
MIDFFCHNFKINAMPFFLPNLLLQGFLHEFSGNFFREKMTIFQLRVSVLG